MNLVEVVCGEKTSDGSLSTAVALAKKLGKIPLVVNDGTGFYISRQLGAFFCEFNALVSEGVDPMSIEEAVLDFGMPMGPAALADFSGLDVNFRVGKVFEESYGARWAVPPFDTVLYGMGFYGRKTGAGWFDYSSVSPVLMRKCWSAPHLVD